MIKLKYYLFSFALISAQLCMCQRQANIWHFGYWAGLDFNSGSPQALAGGMTATDEGCASISDENGNLLFYTDGVSLWDKNHQLMPNGAGLLGNVSATQSSIIIPKPGSNDIYFIFTLDEEAGPDGLNYSEVDMNLNGGLGDITSNKNTSLHSPTTEKITATFHKNDKDIWVVTHLYNSSDFYAYLVTQNGVNTTPVISNSGSMLNIGGLAFDAIGQMKISPNGEMIAMSNMALDEVQLFDFSNSTGTVSNSITFSNYFWAYGLEFSRTNNYLYFNHLKTGGSSVVTEIFQLDLNASNISQSAINIGSLPGIQQQAMQLAPDGKIYIAMENTSFLSLIENPDAQGLASNFNLNGFNLNGMDCGMGLPAYIQSYFNMPSIECDTVCYLDTSHIECIDPSISQISWDFGDPGSGVNNSGSGFNVKHLFSGQGSYEITMEGIKNGSPIYDTLQISLLPEPQININDSIYFCEPETITLDAFLEGATYLWSDQSTGSSIDVNASGTYSIVLTDSNNCSSLKDIELLPDNCPDKVVYLPTSFSPNNDGQNDVLYVRGTGISTLELLIYDRYGKLVFNSNSLNNGWDGTLNNKSLNSAVFMVILDVTFIDGEQKTLKGNITLMR
ncbi:MAG TPA: T9SS type B sorting domain-containing protein [Bacteroidetes bacterium]|nr:T9SS type B sorting domain-containing protein [Bacteroidota bacterium]